MYINLHYFEFLLEQFVHSAKVIHKQSGSVEQVGPDWFEFGYNKSRLHKDEYYLASATFKLTSATKLKTEYARGRAVEIIRHRATRYPDKNTCGSFFRNFHLDEVNIESAGKKMIYVAYYLDKIGVKGQLSFGDATVSYQHANMIINRGNGTTGDIVRVAREMQNRVYKNFGIIPQPECQLIGFKNYPLQ